MIFRILLFLILAYLIFRLLRSLLSTRRREELDSSRRKAGKAEEMVLDPQCQSYLPKAEAIFQDGHYFCSEQCARLYLSR